MSLIIYARVIIEGTKGTKKYGCLEIDTSAIPDADSMPLPKRGESIFVSDEIGSLKIKDINYNIFTNEVSILTQEVYVVFKEDAYVEEMWKMPDDFETMYVTLIPYMKKSGFCYCTRKKEAAEHMLKLYKKEEDLFKKEDDKDE